MICLEFSAVSPVLNFEFRLLEFICYLVIGAWDFEDIGTANLMVPTSAHPPFFPPPVVFPRFAAVLSSRQYRAIGCGRLPNGESFGG